MRKEETVRLTSPIGLISAVSFEGNIILRKLQKVHEKVPYGIALYKGKIHDKSVVSITSGIGKTNASHGATILIERFSPGIIVNFGVGGAYPSSGLKTGDIAIAEKEIYGDEGISLRDGFHTAETIGIPFLVKPGKRYFNEFRVDKKFFKMAVSITRVTHHASKFTVKSGPFFTFSTSTGTLKRAMELEKKFHAICENMEGAAVAHICISYDIPMVEIRGISNIVGDRDMKKWNLKQAAENCQKVVIELLRWL
ncbi:MAG TPA: futalosine hydrolase [Thermodesulfovibrionales bacterium]|nr:futalosine hydrolase [Thermodesulfovibrionales bacterium]